MSYGAGFGTDKMLEIVLPKLDAFEREVRVETLKEVEEGAYRLRERIAELEQPAAPTPEVKKPPTPEKERGKP